MSFISAEYIAFFAIVVPLFFAFPHRRRWLLLLVASYGFYAYGIVIYLPIIALSTIINYISARMIPLRERTRWRISWLALSIISSLGVLFIFKYLDFFQGNVAFVTGQDATSLDLILPIGISFYTFQSMSYTIDVYRRRIQPEKHLGIVATYIAFFPQLVAGPIERATNLLPQFRIEHHFDPKRAIEGFQLILWGVFKKVVIADRLAIYVNHVYADPSAHTGATLWIATFFFAFQIYCDFSGYSYIAIGTARVMGFRLMDNFRQPYFAQSIREFWGRWHISLSTWFRDYLYIPLGGNRVSLARHCLNLMIVFLVSGLWHGAGWTFVFWGGLHGLAIVLLTIMHHYNWRLIPERHIIVKIGITFTFVCFTWIFFRAESLSDAGYIVTHLFRWDHQTDITAPFVTGLLSTQSEFLLSLALIGFLLLAERQMLTLSVYDRFAQLSLVARWSLYYALGLLIVFSSLYSTGAQQFIYFQF